MVKAHACFRISKIADNDALNYVVVKEYIIIVK